MIISVVLKPEQYEQAPDDLVFSKEMQEMIELFRPYKEWFVAEGRLNLELAHSSPYHEALFGIFNG